MSAFVKYCLEGSLLDVIADANCSRADIHEEIRDKVMSKHIYVVIRIPNRIDISEGKRWAKVIPQKEKPMTVKDLNSSVAICYGRDLDETIACMTTGHGKGPFKFWVSRLEEAVDPMPDVEDTVPITKMPNMIYLVPTPNCMDYTDHTYVLNHTDLVTLCRCELMDSDCPDDYKNTPQPLYEWIAGRGWEVSEFNVKSVAAMYHPFDGAH